MIRGLGFSGNKVLVMAIFELSEFIGMILIWKDWEWIFWKFYGRYSSHSIVIGMLRKTLFFHSDSIIEKDIIGISMFLKGLQKILQLMKGNKLRPSKIDQRKI